MKKWEKCYRCEEEYEKLYLVPYLNVEFIEVNICRNCSMEFHRQVKEFTENFLSKNRVLPLKNQPQKIKCKIRAER